jgi:hypothetical protein
VASPMLPMPSCNAYRVLYRSGVFATAPYMRDIGDGSACRALFSDLKAGKHWPDECNNMVAQSPTPQPYAQLFKNVTNPLDCAYLALQCQNYMDSLWEVQEELVMAQLSTLVSEMLRDYKEVAELFSSLADTNYTQIAGLALRSQAWPAVPT